MNTSLKTCFKCGDEKPRSEFYRHSEMGDGLLGKCKECARADVRANYLERREQYLLYERSRKRDPKRVAARKEYQRVARDKVSTAKKSWITRNVNKRAAQIAAGNATRDGRLIKEPCVVCGSMERVHGHHEDYTRPLDVIWLCPKHHAEYHTVRRHAERILQKDKAA